MNAPNRSTPTPLFHAHTSQRLLKKVAVITGASSGLGRAIALAYAAEGALVVCADLEPIAKIHVKEEDAKATHQVIEERGGTAVFQRCDVGDSHSVQDLVKAAIRHFGRLDM